MRLVLASLILRLAALAVADGCQPKLEEIRDASHRLVGTIRTVRDCTLEARDAQGRLRGRYSPKTNETRDPRYRLVSRGNTLPVLLWERQKGR
ncbi:MAG: hypothetical protein AAB225_30005 [Acidobacteriota bacterium]